MQELLLVRYGEIFLNLNKNGEIALPEGITLSRNASEEEAQKTVQYLYEQYQFIIKYSSFSSFNSEYCLSFHRNVVTSYLLS